MMPFLRMGLTSTTNIKYHKKKLLTVKIIKKKKHIEYQYYGRHETNVTSSYLLVIRDL